MKPRDLSELALRNLRESLLRNSLTTLGVAVGVASLVAMLSLGVGLQELASKRLSNSGLFDTVLVSSRSNLRGLGRNGAANSPPPQGARVLDEDARKEMEGLPNVVEVYPQIRFLTEMRYAGTPYSTIVAGIPVSARGNGAFEGIQGTFFRGSRADEAILQMELAKEMSAQPATLVSKELAIRYMEREPLAPSATSDPARAKSDSRAEEGFSIVPREKKLRIVGIVETEPAAGFGGFGSGRLLIPLEVAAGLRAAQVNDLREALRATNAKPTYASLTVRAKNPSQVEAIETAVKKMGFVAFSLLDASRNLRLFFTIFDLLLGIFGSLALSVATLGIINTLVMAILERRREIGILKALGAADRDVRQLFFVEAGVMGLLGGVLGVVFGWFIGRGVTWGTNLYLKRQNLPVAHVFSVPWWLVLGAVAFAVIVSLGAGLYPATRAARLNPVEALRYE
ncbi:MAG TPA: FtsX-like permease family protein [Candidatus Dormibacteraeota bacterium]|nr:FtsX-like permease family protein [Candidatus Dormibacteraeota bacterium]